MKFIYKILDLINDKVLIILLEIYVMIDSISSGRLILAVIWLIIIIFNIINLKDENENEE